MATAAAVALYFAATPRVTFEDAIVADNSIVELSSYPSQAALSQEIMAQGLDAQDISYQQPAPEARDDFAW